MKIFKVLLILMGVCIVSLTVGFSLGLRTSIATSHVIQINTKSMWMGVTFKPETSDLAKDIGVASLLAYLEVLTACLNEPGDLEKIKSTGVLTEFIIGSYVVNALRPGSRRKKRKQMKRAAARKRTFECVSTASIISPGFHQRGFFI